MLEHLHAGCLNPPCRVTVKHEHSSPGARMVPSGGGKRPQLAFNRLGCFQARAYLYEFLCTISISAQEVNFKSVGGPQVAHFGPPPLELIEYRRFERVTQVRAAACIEGRNESGVGKIDLARVAVAFSFRVGRKEYRAQQERIRKMVNMALTASRAMP